MLLLRRLQQHAQAVEILPECCAYRQQQEQQQQHLLQPQQPQHPQQNAGNKKIVLPLLIKEATEEILALTCDATLLRAAAAWQAFFDIQARYQNKSEDVLAVKTEDVKTEDAFAIKREEATMAMSDKLTDENATDELAFPATKRGWRVLVTSATLGRDVPQPFLPSHMTFSF